MPGIRGNVITASTWKPLSTANVVKLSARKSVHFHPEACTTIMFSVDEGSVFNPEACNKSMLERRDHFILPPPYPKYTHTGCPQNYFPPIALRPLGTQANPSGHYQSWCVRFSLCTFPNPRTPNLDFRRTGSRTLCQCDLTVGCNLAFTTTLKYLRCPFFGSP